MAEIISIKTELLSREYSYLQARYNLYSKEYKSLYIYSGTYLTLFVGFVGYLLTHATGSMPNAYIQAVLALSFCYVYSGAANLFDSLQQLFLIEGRMGAIERLINEDQKETIYNFESKIMRRELGAKNWHLGKGIINPAHIWAIWNGLFLITLTGIHIIFFSFFCDVPLIKWTFICITGGITIFSSYNWFWLNSLNGKRDKEIRDHSIIKPIKST